MQTTHLDRGGPVGAYLVELMRSVRAATPPGRVADYIPELAGADPEHFGLAVVSVLGHAYDAGDALVPFTVQSASKPFVLALAIETLGMDVVGEHVGVEPSGQPFNAISFDAAGRPANPMINVGAITTTSLVPAGSADERFEVIRAKLSAFAGRELTLDRRVYESEASTGDRNVALATLARANGVLVGSVADAVDPYFRQCSVLVTARDLATMGATLAAGGVNPVTDQQVVSADTARQTLSVMAGCGMYDRSGGWLVDVGMPAKSGVGGGIVAVTPGGFGVGVFSPPLDEAGNSALGTAALKTLSREYGLHLFRRVSTPVSPVDDVTVDEGGGRVAIRLRGELDFVAVERIVDEFLPQLPPQAATVVIDLEPVTRVEPIAARMLATLGQVLRAAQHTVALHDPHHLLPPTDGRRGCR